MTEHYRKLERMYLAAPINEIYEPRISISEGEATIEMEARPQLFHAAGALHGSVYFKGLDDAAFFAVSCLTLSLREPSESTPLMPNSSLVGPASR